MQGQGLKRDGAGDRTSAPAAPAQPLAILSGTAWITITSASLVPAAVMVTVGSDVVWYNATSTEVRVQSGQPYHAYVPVVMHGDASLNDVASGQAARSPAGAAETFFSGTLPPGGTLTITFTGLGSFPYFLSSDPRFVGTINVQAPTVDFALDVQPHSQATPRGTSIQYMATVIGLISFMAPVMLSLSGLPASVAADIAPNPVAPTGTAGITLTPALTTALGSYALTLTVNQQPDFTLNAQPAALNIRQSRTVTAQIRVGSLASFTEPVTYTAQVTGTNGWNMPLTLSLAGSAGGRATKLSGS